MVSAWSNCLSQLYPPHQIERKDRYTTSNDRPHIYVLDYYSGSAVDSDIALSHPLCKDVFPIAARSDGAAASRREEKKKFAAEEVPCRRLLTLSTSPCVNLNIKEGGGRMLKSI